MVAMRVVLNSTLKCSNLKRGNFHRKWLESLLQMKIVRMGESFANRKLRKLRPKNKAIVSGAGDAPSLYEKAS